MTYQFDDAVTAFRNGCDLSQLGFSPEFIEIYRTYYLMGMTYGIPSESMPEGPAHEGLIDAEIDLEFLREEAEDAA